MDDRNPLFEHMIRMARQQYGDALRAFWGADLPGCPGCSGPIRCAGGDTLSVNAFFHRPAGGDTLSVNAFFHRPAGGDTLPVNAFFHRPAGVLIAYLLCGHCAEQIHRTARRNPGRKIALHDVIEKNLSEAFAVFRRSLEN